MKSLPTKLILALSFLFTITINAQCWQSFSEGSTHSLAIKGDGTLWAWGFNGYGQVGNGNTTNQLTPIQIGTATNWKMVSCAGYYSMAIKTDGTLWAWGFNSTGQLGNGTTTGTNVPTQIGVATNWSFINLGESHAIAIKTDGTLWTWGKNSNGQLGNSTTTNLLIPTQIGLANNWQSAAGGFNVTMAIKTDGTLWGCGLNYNGQLGDGTSIQRTSLVQIGVATTWSAIACGQSQTIALKTNGTLWTWGDNYEGQLGDGTNSPRNTPAQVGTGTNWKAVDANYRHSVATKTDGTFWAWGYNGNGQIGNGTLTNTNVPTQVGVANNWNIPGAGSNTSSALKTDGTIWGCGYNGSGQIGDGTNADKLTVVLVSSTCTAGAALNFDGVNDYVLIGAVIPVNSSYTKEAWIYANDNGTCNIISSTSSPFWLSGGLLSAMNNGGTVLSDPTSFALNVWTHVAVTFNAATAELKLYKNGLLVNSALTFINYPSEVISIGQYGGANNFNGSMDEVRIWNVARTQCEINTYMNCEIPTTAASLIANYHFNQGYASNPNPTVTSLIDASGSVNTGTLVNFSLVGAASNWVAPSVVVSGFTTSISPPNVGSTIFNPAICLGQQLTKLVGTGADTYTWTNGVANNFAFSPTITATYTVTGTNTLSGCTNTAVATVTVNALPTVAVNSGTICSGSTFTMSPSGATTYVYSNGSNTVTPTSNTNYTVTGTDVNGCNNKAVSNVTVNTLPTVIVNSGAICSGSTFTMSPSGATTYVYSNGSNTVTPTSNTNYTVTGTDVNGCNNTAVSTVTVNALPTVIVNSGAICNGSTFTMSPSGASTYVYSNGSNTATPSANTDYTVTGTNVNGCENTAVSSVTVNALPTVAVTSGAICNGATYTMTPSGASTYTFSNGSNTVSPTANTDYTVSGTDANGCNNTAVSNVTVNALPTVFVNSGAICYGSTFTMSPSGAVSYVYSNGSNTATPTANTDYTVTGTDVNGCNNTTVSTVTVNTLPTVSANTSNTITCTSQTVTLNATGATSYTWNTTATGASISVNPSVTTSYTVTGIGVNGCVNTGVITQSVSTCTGIDNSSLITTNASLVIYPNPSNGVYTIDVTTTTQVSIYNALGVVVYSNVLEVGSHQLNLSAYANGMYVVKANGTVMRLIKE